MRCIFESRQSPRLFFLMFPEPGKLTQRPGDQLRRTSRELHELLGFLALDDFSELWQLGHSDKQREILFRRILYIHI